MEINREKDDAGDKIDKLISKIWGCGSGDENIGLGELISEDELKSPDIFIPSQLFYDTYVDNSHKRSSMSCTSEYWTWLFEKRTRENEWWN